MLTTTIVTYILTMNDAAIVGVPKDTDVAAFLDSVAADAGYLAIRDDGPTRRSAWCGTSSTSR